MGFFDEIKKSFTDDELDLSFKFECFGGSALSVVGYKKIVSIDEAEIKLIVGKKTLLTVTGAKLFIRLLEVEELVIAGKIMNVSIVEN